MKGPTILAYSADPVAAAKVAVEFAKGNDKLVILGGAMGNLIDRLFAPPAFGRGHVTDFLAYGNWFIGNFADVALGAGVMVLAGSLWIRRQRTRTTAEGDHTATAPMLEVGR